MSGGSNFWGGDNNSKQYLMELENTGPYVKPDKLIAHSFTNFNNEQIDRVVATVVRFVHGQIVEQQKVLRPARRTAVTFTVGMGGEGEIYTPLLARIRRARGACALNLYIKRLCNQNDEFAHFYAMLDTVFNPPTFVNDLITISDTTDVVSQQAEARASDMVLVYQVGAFKLADEVPPLYAVVAKSDSCSDCDTGEFDGFYAAGGAGGGSDAAYIISTADRFNTVSVLTSGIANGNSVKSLYTDGDVLVAGYADTPDPTTAETGGIVVSADAGATFTPATGLSTLPVNALSFFDGQYLAAGGAGGAQGMLWSSDDAITWTSITSAALSATKEITSIAVDPDNECFYLTGAGGELLKGTKSGSTVQLAALAPAGVSTTYLWKVGVFGDNHIAVGGASGYYVESLDGGNTWVTPQVPGSTAVRGFGGVSRIRAMLATGAVVCDRTILSENQYVAKSLQAGATIGGVYTDMTSGDENFNYGIAVTDGGEVVMLKPFAPGA